MKKILITGATGFIGNCIVEELTKNNKEYKLVVIGRKLKSWNINFTKKNIKYIDLLNDQLSKLGNFEIIVHCAALLEDSKKKYSWNDYYNYNVRIILRILKNIKYKKFIHISSGSVFSTNSKDINPNSFYGLSKYLGEKMVEIFSKDNNKQYFIFRLPIVIGLNSNKNFLDQFATNMLKNKEIEIYGDGKIKRNIIHVNAIGKLILKSCMKKKFKNKFCVFNVGSSKSMSINEIAKLIKRLLNSNSKIVKINKVRRSNFDSIINITQIKKVFNFETKTTGYYVKKHISEKYL